MIAAPPCCIVFYMNTNHTAATITEGTTVRVTNRPAAWRWTVEAADDGSGYITVRRNDLPYWTDTLTVPAWAVRAA